MSQRTDLYRPKQLTCLLRFSVLNICVFMRERGAACFEKLLLWDTAVYIIFTTPLKRAVNISLFYSFFFFSTSRVLETVRSVRTSRMDCSACLAVPKACQARTTRWCGNTQTRWKCASYATRTALKGKSIVQPARELTLLTPCVANTCLS